METKKCAKCGRELPVTEFFKCSMHKDGLHSYCKECATEATRINRKKGKSAQTIQDVYAIAKATEDPENPLARFEPVELIAELKRRGYVWDKMYVKMFVDYNKI